MPCAELFINLIEHLLVLKEVALLAWLKYVYEVVSYWLPVVHVFAQIFSCPNTHAAIELARIGADDLASKRVSKFYR